MITFKADIEKPLSRMAKDQIDSVAENLSMTAASQRIKHVHDLRIATRRALVGIELLQSVLPVAERKWFERKLRQIRRAAGEVRDLDVMIQRHAKDRRLVQKLTKRRTESFGQIHDVYRRLIDEGRFAKHQSRLLDPLTRPNEAEPFIDEALCLEAFDVIAADFLEAARPMSLKIRRLHRLRKRGKHLRYALEMMSDHLPEELIQRLQETCRSLQSRLGEIMDHVVAIQCISSLEKATKGKQARKDLRRLRKEERKRLKESKRQLEAWWTPQLVQELESVLGPKDSPLACNVERIPTNHSLCT